MDSFLTVLLNREQARGGPQIAQSASENGRAWWFARVLVGVAAELCEPEDDLSNGRLVLRWLRAELDRDERAQLERVELRSGRRVRRVASEMFEPFDADGDGGENRGPTLHGSGRSQLGRLDITVAALPRAVKVFDAPTLRVSVDDEHRLVVRLDGMIGVHEPIDRIFARRRGAFLTRPDGRDRQRADAPSFLFAQSKLDA